MPRIRVPDGPGTERARMWRLRPELGEAHALLSRTVYEQSILPVRIQEAVRFTIARVNACPI